MFKKQMPAISQTRKKTSVDYYPFGLTLGGTSYQRIGEKENRFKYNGKELQTDLDLNWYDYGARMYMPELGRWGVVDPKSEVGRRWSPYNYVLDNPLKFTDPDGMIWKDQKEADQLSDKTLNRMGELMTKNAKLNYEIKNGELSDKQIKKLQKEVNSNNSLIGELQSSLCDIQNLGADQNHIYDLVNNTGVENHVYLGDDGVINIQGTNDALHIHEIKHVALSLNSAQGFQWNSDNLLMPTMGHGKDDEITAYKAQYAFSPTSLVNSPSYEGINYE